MTGLPRRPPMLLTMTMLPSCRACHHADQPVVGDDVVVQDLAELLVGDAGHRPVVGVAGGVAHQGVDAAPLRQRAVHQGLQRVFAADVGGHGQGRAGTVRGVDLGGHGLAGVLLARADHHPGAVLGQAVGDGAADAARRAGDHGHLAFQVEQGAHADPLAAQRPWGGRRGLGENTMRSFPSR